MRNLPIFVYGTLKQGQCREGSWPRRPLSVSPATVRGCLYDLGSFPALVEATGRVAGEAWYLADGDFEVSLRRLDHIEGYSGNPDDLYVRRETDCQTETGQTIRSYAYYFAHPEELGADQLIPPDDSGVTRWPVVRR